MKRLLFFSLIIGSLSGLSNCKKNNNGSSTVSPPEGPTPIQETASAFPGAEGFGRNATGYSFLTGYGIKSTKHPHHRPSVADGIAEPVPGLLAGGPNPGKQDKCTYEFSEPETAYADTDCSYASNEIAINWNAPLVYLLHAVEALSRSIFKD